jgi:hypothetical protein
VSSSRPVLVLVDAVDFLNANDQNEVRLPVVKYLASQRAGLIQTLVTYRHGGPPSFDQPGLPLTMPAGGLRPRTKCGAGKLTSDRAMQTGKVLLAIALLNKRTSTASRSRAASCSAVWGFGFRRTGPWARPRPGALGDALVMPRKIWSGPVLPPPKFPGVVMGSCLPAARADVGQARDFVFVEAAPCPCGQPLV